MIRRRTTLIKLPIMGCLAIISFMLTTTRSVTSQSTGPPYDLAHPGCLACHDKIENIHTRVQIPCTFCHGGDYTTDEKEKAHVQPTLPVIMDNTTPPLDYDLPYQQFVNPSNLRVVDRTCGVCHVLQVDWVKKSLMATTAGHHAGGLYQNGVVDTKTPIYGNFAIRDDDGDVPTERGAVEELRDLIEYDPTLDQSLVSTHYRAVPGQACARCHLWTRGKGYRGAEDVDGTYRADGCAACHMIYADDGRSQSADTSIDHQEQGHPLAHRITRAIPTGQCLHCHHRGARIGLSFTGRAQMPPRLPAGPGVPGTTNVKFNNNYHYTDPATNPPDIHWERGLHCIDCHTEAGVMGDGNIYGHMDQATKIECRTCHGVPWQEGTLTDADGKPLWNVHRQSDGAVVLTSKVDGRQHLIPQVKDIVDPNSPRFNPRAAAAMNANHLKPQGGLECYACHAAWMPNCFGCHFERDERQTGINLITRKEEVGKVRTSDKVYVSLKHFAIGYNAEERVSPYIVGCQPIADVTAPDGTKKLNFVMPVTVNGLSGLALNPVNPHTIRSVGEVRTCAECHRSPPSLGLGSGNYSLARTYAFAVGSDGILVFDRWTDPRSPQLVGELPAGRPLAMAITPNVVSGRADYLYVASGRSGLFVFDLREGIPDAPVAVIDDIEAIDVSRAADYLYVVVRGVGINIYSTEDARHPELVATVSIPTARRAVPWGIHLFVAAGEAGLVVVNISDHHAPRIAGGLSGIKAVDVRLYAHHQIGPAFAARAYVADPDFGVRVIDLLPEFSSPKLVGGLPLPGASALDTYTRWLVTDGVTPSREHDYLYVAAGASGLHVFDITQPDNIVPVAALTDLGGRAVDVDVASQMNPPGVDDYALIANSDAGLQVVDVTDPRHPTLVTTVGSEGISRVVVEVQQMDRFIDEQGHLLKENSHPGARALSREDIVRILSADISVDRPASKAAGRDDRSVERR